MSLYKNIISGEVKLSLIGLGYVGMPLAVAFAEHNVKVIGFDVNSKKIELYKSGVDPTHEVGDEAIKASTVEFTCDEARLKEAKFHIVAVPTPVNVDHTPDLTPVESASTIVGRNLTKGSVVVYESTVYPGVTEDVCVSILEKESGLSAELTSKSDILRNESIPVIRYIGWKPSKRLYPVWMKRPATLFLMYIILS